MAQIPSTTFEGKSPAGNSNEPGSAGNSRFFSGKNSRVPTSGTSKTAIYATGEAWGEQNLLGLDGGGIRGYWTLLMLQDLMEKIGEEEKKRSHQAEHCGSFEPHPFPSGATHGPLTEGELRKQQIPHPDGILATFYDNHRKFLPSHYFDYICGSSTGALIAIMLGRFRMSVYDCLCEYENMSDDIFGSPRLFPQIHMLFNSYKYNAKNMEKAIKDVVARRTEISPQIHNVHFPSDPIMCKTFVTTIMATKTEEGTMKSYLFRSYDHVKNKDLNFLEASYSANTNNTTGMMNEINYGPAEELDIWQVARAATAAPVYFRPIKITQDTVTGRNIKYFSDGGFSPLNNPTKQGLEEIESLHGKSKVGVIVSIGTARGTTGTEKNNLINIVKRSIYETSDPELVHYQLNSIEELRHSYWRFNDSDSGLRVQLDEWKPSGLFVKEPGRKTLRTIREHFNNWARDNTNAKNLRNCAKALVKRRRARAEDRSMWEAYATGAVFACNLAGCPKTRFETKGGLEQHLRDDHSIDDADMDRAVKHMTRRWQYQEPPKS